MTEEKYIDIQGACEHNLKNIDLKIPRDRLVVITGLSGSGKSSLAFDTIYAEGQRRYIETFSSYARRFLGEPERPNVEKIDGLSPVIAIEQKTTNRSPRSTVGTITEIYDFLRLLFSKIAIAYSSETGKPMVSYSKEQIQQTILDDFKGKAINLLSPVVKSRKGHYRELFEQIAKKGFLKVRIDGEIKNIHVGMKLDRYKNHDIEIVIDRLILSGDTEQQAGRLSSSIQEALKQGKGSLMVCEEGASEIRYFSSSLMCPDTGLSYPNPEPNTFSFNSPKGMCTHCNGLGYTEEIALQKIIRYPEKSIEAGAIELISNDKSTWIIDQIKTIGKRYGFTTKTPVKDIPKEGMHMILYGGSESFTEKNTQVGVSKKHKIEFEGIVNFLTEQLKSEDENGLQGWVKNYTDAIECKYCHGARLSGMALNFKISEKNIAELSAMSIDELSAFFRALPKKLSKNQKEISEGILKEIAARVAFLQEVGLNYLSLGRSSKTLSGGESQRIRLATQIGSQLTGVLYILDEPSIGLHQRDNDKLIQSLKTLREQGNSIIVVEHDKEMMLQADYIVDMGPKAGKFGGDIVFKGTPQQMKEADTETAKYINGAKEIAPLPYQPRAGSGKTLKLFGCKGNNLKDINVAFPLGKMIAVTGVSGSGKSTLINETLYPILNAHFFNGVKKPLAYSKIEGLEHLDKVIDIDQSPIGRTPRSNPATYTGVLSDIRQLFAKTPESMIRGYKPGRFSFNVAGGRCETCGGAGLKVIEMNFLPDVYVECETCNGKRFNRETLEIRYKGKSIYDVLEMSIDEAVLFFENIPSIYRVLTTIQSVGLGYITLGQSSTTLSGGEAQRIKLASELSKRDTGNTFYILDEPTTGLHFEDIQVLIGVLNKLVDKGNTVLVIEHNIDVIKCADHIIDIGPEAGSQGGEVVAQGTPKEAARWKNSHTAKYIN